MKTFVEPGRRQLVPKVASLASFSTCLFLLVTTVFVNRIRQLFEELNKRFDEGKMEQSDLNEALETYYNMLAENNKSVKEQAAELSKCRKDISQLHKENDKLNERINDLREGIDDSKQYVRCNTIEIVGNPERVNEDLCEVVKMVGNSLDSEINRSMIIMKFVYQRVKEEMLNWCRVKRNFSTKDVGFGESAGAVYIGYLTPYKK